MPKPMSEAWFGHAQHTFTQFDFGKNGENLFQGKIGYSALIQHTRHSWFFFNMPEALLSHARMLLRSPGTKLHIDSVVVAHFEAQSVPPKS